MEQLSKVAGIYLLIVALLAGLQFIFQPTYTEIAGFSDGQIWGFLDWFLAVGVIISVFVLGRSFLQDSTSGSNLTITSVLLFVSVGVGLAFFHNWAATLAGTGDAANESFWKFIDAIIVPAFLATGWCLWSTTKNDDAEEEESE